MKKLRFFDLLKSKKFELTEREFKATAEPNPFMGKPRRRKGMDAYVRDGDHRRGLDKVSRSYTGSDSGVNGSRYDNMVRDIDDLEADFFDNLPDFDKEDDNLYLKPVDRSYRRNEFNHEDDIDDLDAEAGWKFMRQLDADLDDEEYGADIGDIMGGEKSQDNAGDNDDEMENEPKSTQYDGIIRSVKGAYLVSKKQQPDETFTEVWIYNVGDKYDEEANIRKNILSGTDIDPTKNFSEDGSQEAVIKSMGNIQYLTVVGLPD